MPRMILWHCDNCDYEVRGESPGSIVVKEFGSGGQRPDGRDRPRFYSFCNWACLHEWLSDRVSRNLVGQSSK